MTEEEAKTKWCPFARVVTATGSAEKSNQIAGSPVSNRMAINGVAATIMPKGSLCLGSTCMVWRWEDVAPSEYGLSKWRPGYCGLAGQN